MADCSVSTHSGAATSDSSGRKRERYCIQPRNHSTAFLLSGLEMSLIALAFREQGTIALHPFRFVNWEDQPATALA